MKNLLLSILIALFILAFCLFCKTDDPIPVSDPEMNDKNWIKRLLTGKERGLTAIYGNYEDTLIVATRNDLYMTTDKGGSWKKVYGGSTGISGIVEFKGELIAFNRFGNNSSGPFLFSRDIGETWSQKGKRDF